MTTVWLILFGWSEEGAVFFSNLDEWDGYEESIFRLSYYSF